MRIKLVGTYYLTDETGEPRLVHGDYTGDYGPDDVAQLFPSWPRQAVRISVRDAVATLAGLSLKEEELVAAFCRMEPATS